jgi:hypothetical protein
MRGNQPTKKQKLVAIDKYKSFIAGVTESKDKFSNQFNIFDDSDKKDKEWLSIAKHYLSKKNRRSK